MIGFLALAFKLVVFSLLFSFAIGALLLYVMVPLAVALFEKGSDPIRESRAAYWISSAQSLIIGVGQGAIVAGAVTLSASESGTALAVLQYALGAVLSIPLATLLALRVSDTRQTQFPGWSIGGALLAFALFAFRPVWIPGFLLAVSRLLAVR